MSYYQLLSEFSFIFTHDTKITLHVFFSGMVDVLWGKAQTNMKLVSGASCGVAILFGILVCMCVITCR